MDLGLMTRLFQQAGDMICDIFGGAQHGADDKIEFGHGMDPDVIERNGEPGFYRQRMWINMDKAWG
ncbi:hypothetical protein D3C74_499260 [compost metagenome]